MPLLTSDSGTSGYRPRRVAGRAAAATAQTQRSQESALSVTHIEIVSASCGVVVGLTLCCLHSGHRRSSHGGTSGVGERTSEAATSCSGSTNSDGANEWTSDASDASDHAHSADNTSEQKSVTVAADRSLSVFSALSSLSLCCLPHRSCLIRSVCLLHCASLLCVMRLPRQW